MKFSEVPASSTEMAEFWQDVLVWWVAWNTGRELCLLCSKPQIEKPLLWEKGSFWKGHVFAEWTLWVNTVTRKHKKAFLSV